MAKTKPVDLAEVFTTGEDGRLYCTQCDFDTAKEGSARRHTMAVHQTELKPLAIVMKKRGVIPQELPTEIIEVPVQSGEGA